MCKCNWKECEFAQIVQETAAGVHKFGQVLNYNIANRLYFTLMY